MIRLLQWLLTGCAHEWEEDSRHELVRGPGAIPHGIVSLCHCKKCGVPKRFDLS